MCVCIYIYIYNVCVCMHVNFCNRFFKLYNKYLYFFISFYSFFFLTMLNFKFISLLLLFLQAYAAGCDIAILASDFQRVQVIPGVTHGNIKVSCVDCSTDTGKVRRKKTLLCQFSFFFFLIN